MKVIIVGRGIGEENFYNNCEISLETFPSYIIISIDGKQVRLFSDQIAELKKILGFVTVN